jgi:hypothetical protein
MKRKYIRPAMGAVRMELTSIINGSQDGWEVIPPDGPNTPAAPLSSEPFGMMTVTTGARNKFLPPLPALFSFICPPTRRVAYFFTFLLFYFFTFSK